MKILTKTLITTNVVTFFFILFFGLVLSTGLSLALNKCHGFNFLANYMSPRSNFGF